MTAEGTPDPPELQRLLGALSSPVRREILWLIWDRELAAGEIAAAFTRSAPTISQHLAVLRDAGLVTMEVDGTFRRYRARQEVLADVRHLLAADDAKWRPGAAPGPASSTRTVAVVVVERDAPCPPAAAFRAFTDATLYGRWLGVPVSLSDGAFSATMEWGLHVRGTYDHVVEPSLIVMTWDFEQDAVPLPGEGHRAYLEIVDGGASCRVIVHQLVREYRHARRMERAWGLMLDRFADNALAALDVEREVPMRPSTRRPRR